MAKITLDHIKKAYGDTVIMEDMNFTVQDGERLVLLGPSGCGKSTILRMIAGFEEITDGNLYFNEERMNDVAPGKRNVGMVFQNYALYPHMTVRDNITYGLRINKVPQDEINRRVDEVVEGLRLTKYMDRKPAELSGGQRQRVALARATVKNSDVFLLDEPLSNLDAKLRVSAREALVDIHNRYGQTMVYVTHDQIEAMTFGTHIALLNFGELQQLDTPENIYRKPANIFTARFIGNPPMNVLDTSHYDNGKLVIGDQAAKLYDNWVNYIEDKGVKNVRFGIRPESVRVHEEPNQHTFQAQISRIENQGANYAHYVKIGDDELTFLNKFRQGKEGDFINIEFINDQLSVFDAETTNNIGYPNNILNKIKASSGLGGDLTELIQEDDARQAREDAED